MTLSPEEIIRRSQLQLWGLYLEASERSNGRQPVPESFALALRMLSTDIREALEQMKRENDAQRKLTEIKR